MIDRADRVLDRPEISWDASEEVINYLVRDDQPGILCQFDDYFSGRIVIDRFQFGGHTPLEARGQIAFGIF